MRLELINNNLSKKYNEISFMEAKKIFQDVFWKAFESQEESIKKSLFDKRELSNLSDKNLDLMNDLSQLTETLDSLYFDFEEKNDLTKSEFYFKQARIVSSLDQYIKAKSNTDISEATYEALMSLDNPEEINFFD